MNIKHLYLLLVMAVTLYSKEQSVAIEPFQEDRDMPAIEKILSDYPDFLTYESQGYQEGTTIKYIKSPNYITYALRVNGEIVGFINYMVEEPPFLFSFFMEKRGCIHLIGVETKHQSHGYGRMLLRHALQELQNKNLSCTFLSVSRHNKKARAFYEAEGFACIYPEAIRECFSDLFYEITL